MDKQIVDVQVQRNSRPDVVGFATVDNAAGVKQDQARHDHNHCCRNGQRQGRDLQEDIGGEYLKGVVLNGKIVGACGHVFSGMVVVAGERG